VRIFIDTSVFIRHYYGIEKSLKLLNLVINENEAVISPNIIEETFFKLLYIETERIFGRTGKFIVKEGFKKHKDKFKTVESYISDFLIESIESDVIGLLDINNKILKNLIEIAFRHTLLPNDALIAATCKYYGIKKIATFDEDFKRIDFLEVIEIE